MAIIYGYNDDARSSDTSRLWSNIWSAAEWVALAVTVMVMLGLCPWTAGATCATGYTLLAIDIASMAVLVTQQYERGLLANIGRNQYGCSFPEGGFVHTYSAIIANPAVNPFLGVNDTTLQQNPALSGFSATSLMNQKTILVLGMAAALILLISSMGDE
mgnify:CR=1 FL=1